MQYFQAQGQLFSIKFLKFREAFIKKKTKKVKNF